MGHYRFGAKRRTGTSEEEGRRPDRRYPHALDSGSRRGAAVGRAAATGPRSAEGRMKRRIGYAPGVYDLFHVGHLNLLARARERCDHLVAGVVTDELATLAKGRAPVVPLNERLEIVRSIRYVDEAVAEVVPEKLDTW